MPEEKTGGAPPIENYEMWEPPYLNRRPTPPFLVKDNVAWEIPKIIADKFLDGVYLPPEGWSVRREKLPDTYKVCYPCGQLIIDRRKGIHNA